jgi:signal transduction histidine kinase/ligand-binding sensor domain-containing protein
MTSRAALRASILVALFALASPVAALPIDRLPSQYVHRQWDESSGLPQNTVYAMARGGDERLFLATEEGLVVWNGHRFEVHDKREHPALTTSAIRALAPRAAGGVWLATRAGDVCWLDGAALECIPQRAGLPAQFVAALATEDGGALVACGSAGVFRIEAPDRAPRVAHLSTRPCRAVLAHRGDLLAGGDQGLFAIEPASVDGGSIPEREVVPGAIRALAVDRGGALWVARSDGLLRAISDATAIDGAAEALALDVPGDTVGLVHGLTPGPGGELYVATERGLFHRAEDGALTRLSEEHRVFCAIAWGDRHLFFGAAFSGLHLLEASLAIPYGTEEGLPFGPASAVATSDDGSLWVGTFAGEVVRMDVRARGPRVLGAWGTAEGLGEGSIWSVAPLGGGAALVGAPSGLFRVSSAGVERLDERTVISIASGALAIYVSFADERVVRFDRVELARGSARAVEISLRGAPPSAGRETLRMLDVIREDTLYVAGPPLARALSGQSAVEALAIDVVGTIYGIEESDDGALWIGTSHGGLYRSRDGRTDRLTIREGLHDDTFFSLSWMPALDALVSSSNRGIAVYPRAALEDGVRTGTVRPPWVIDTRDGMRSRECNGYAGARDGAGGLWFATARGVVHVPVLPRAQRAEERGVVVFDRAAVDGVPSATRDTVELAPDALELALELSVSPLVLAPWARYQYSLARVGDDDAPFVELGAPTSLRLLRPRPGDYAVRARLIGRDGVPGPITTLRVHVAPRLHEATWFRVLVAGLFLFAIALAGWSRLAAARRRERELERVVAERTGELRARSESLADALERLSRIQADLLRAERLAATATMVRGIAHELSNPIGMVAGNVAVLARYSEHLLRVARALRDRSAAGDRDVEALVRLTPKKSLDHVAQDLPALLADIDEGLRRAKLIVADLGDLDRGVESRAIETTSIERAIAGSRRMLETARGALPEIAVECEPGAAIQTYAGLVEQVLTNLLSNAVDAVGEVAAVASSADVAPISVRARRVDRGIELAVIDRGSGMEPEVLARAAEPFFTTKSAGRGTGLGLAMTLAMVRSAGGRVAIDSAPGRGTEVTVLLPSLTGDGAR